MKILLIVESPSKCKTIEKYLGEGYKCLASCGHIRQLIASATIDPRNLEYEIEESKRKNINEIKREMSGATDIVLATDADREGEAIAWHLCTVLGLSVETTKRIVFHEITEPALRKAMATPRRIDMNIVFSQQSRSVLDILIGYNTTPILWKNIKAKGTALSAGRCQTPALKIIYENQLKHDEQILSSNDYKIIGYFTGKNIQFEFCGEVKDPEQFLNIQKEKQSFIMKREIPIVKTRTKPSPLITSTLQQLASNKLNISPSDTMKYCQSLYEAGMITYMRTDCVRYSNVFLEKAREFIISEYGEKSFASSEESVESMAHEAIRPTNINVREFSLLSAKETKLYKLIWERTVESCMTDEEYYSLKTTVNDEEFINISESTLFAGWNVFGKKRCDKVFQYLMKLPNNAPVEMKKITATVICERGVGHLTEAGLVQRLEELGIGRPSTFASIIEKIKERKYVVKEHVPGIEKQVVEYEMDGKGALTKTENTILLGSEKNKLVLQPLGKQVIEFINKNIPTLFEYNYTREMEQKLDEVSAGKLDWLSLCDECKTVCVVGSPKVEKAGTEMGTETVAEKAGTVVEIRKGKYGKYAVLDGVNYSLSSLGNRPIENISMKEVMEIINKNPVVMDESIVREVSKNLAIRRGKWGNYIFYKTWSMKTPEFYKLAGFKGNYMTCSESQLLEYIVSVKK